MEENASKFFLDVKTRANGFRNNYEGYLFCCGFEDGGKVDCACLHLDLKYDRRTPASAPIHISVTPAALDRPAERLRDFVRLQAETVETGDEYLAALFSEGSYRAATFALIKEDNIPRTAADVDRRVWTAAEELGLKERWKQGQDLIKQTKSREREEVERAIQLYRKPTEGAENRQVGGKLDAGLPTARQFDPAAIYLPGQRSRSIWATRPWTPRVREQGIGNRE